MDLTILWSTRSDLSNLTWNSKFSIVKNLWFSIIFMGHFWQSSAIDEVVCGGVKAEGARGKKEGMLKEQWQPWMQKQERVKRVAFSSLLNNLNHSLHTFAFPFRESVFSTSCTWRIHQVCLFPCSFWSVYLTARPQFPLEFSHLCETLLSYSFSFPPPPLTWLSFTMNV